MDVEIVATDCPNPLCEFEQTISINTLTGEAECASCETEWTYGQHELLEILMNLEENDGCRE